MNAQTLTTQESEALEVLFAKVSKKNKNALNLSQVLQKWGFFVGRAEQGYQDSLQEYSAELSTRNILEDVLREAPEPARSKLAAMIRPYDDRFREATTELGKPLSPGMTQWAAPWWCRVPKRRLGQLASDLEAEKILDRQPKV